MQQQNEVSDKYGIKAIGIACNVTKYTDCENVMAKDQRDFGKLDF